MGGMGVPGELEGVECGGVVDEHLVMVLVCV